MSSETTGAAGRPAEYRTVEVNVGDLWRLLLDFRDAIEDDHGRGHQDHPRWYHAEDHDWRFERLADVVDKALTEAGGKPDPRTRCKFASVYLWPTGRGPVRWTAIRMHHQLRLKHLAPAPDHNGFGDTLCGMRFDLPDLIKTPKGVWGQCPVCEREKGLRRLP